MVRTFKAALCTTAALVVAATGSAAQAQIFQDNVIGYRYGTQFKEPGVAGGADIEKSILSFTHVSGDRWGGNFFNIDVLFSGSNDPARNGGAGAQEAYAVYRRTFSYSKLSGSRGAWGPIADVGLQLGGDVNTKNTQFAPEKRFVVAGPYIAWAVPAGYLTTAFQVCREWNYNGIVGRADTFDTTFCFEAGWKFPFKVGPASLSFGGFFNVVAPKGRDGFNAETKTELLTRPELMLDAGELATGRKGVVEIGIGYEYWLNKFGNDSATTVGALARTPMLIGKVHF